MSDWIEIIEKTWNDNLNPVEFAQYSFNPLEDFADVRVPANPEVYSLFYLVSHYLKFRLTVTFFTFCFV